MYYFCHIFHSHILILHSLLAYALISFFLIQCRHTQVMFLHWSYFTLIFGWFLSLLCCSYLIYLFYWWCDHKQSFQQDLFSFFMMHPCKFFCILNNQPMLVMIYSWVCWLDIFHWDCFLLMLLLIQMMNSLFLSWFLVQCFLNYRG